MAVLTSAHAALKYKGVVVGRVRNFDMNISRAALNTTQLGDWDETYRNGLRTGTASATLLYDPSEAQMVAMMNGIFSDSDTPDAVLIEFDAVGGKTAGFNAFITSMGASTAYGEAQACSIEFQITGAVTDSF